MSAIVRVTRREFLVRTGVGTGAFVLGCYISPKGLFAENVFHKPFQLNNFVAIEPLHGTIHIMSFRSEMGQGIRSSLAAVLADELEADWSRVELRQADADGPRYAIGHPSPNGLPSYLINDEVAQFADSSRSMALYYQPMRLFGAGIRLVMERAAAKKFGVDPSQCEAKQHKVHNKKTGESVEYHHLLLYAATVGVPQMPEITAALKPPDKWNYIGKDTMPFADAVDMVTGRARYGADADPERSGMLTAMIERCPVANGEVKSFDDTEARKVPGVVDVVKLRLPPPNPAGGVGAGFAPHAGVAVLAKNTWAALQGRRVLKIEWDLGPNAQYDSDDYRKLLKERTDAPGAVARKKGDVAAAFDRATQVVKADYYVPHLAQAPMEPPAAVALYENGKWEIWSPTQGPELTQHYVGVAMLEPDPRKWFAWQVNDPDELLKESEQAAQRDFNDHLGRELGLDLKGLLKLRDDLKKRVRDAVKVHVTFLGGGFGRKSKPDYAIEAAFLAQQKPGIPIRVQWTREDDIRFSYFHAVSHQHLEAALDEKNRVTGWLHRSAFPSFFASLFQPVKKTELAGKARATFHNGGEYPYASGIERAQGLEDTPFNVPNLRIENCPAESHIRVGWMRSVSNIFHAFAIGSFVDELAHKADADPKDYLLELIGTGRILNLGPEAVTNFDNNGFPPIDWEGRPAVIRPYPPDTSRLRGVIERVATESGWKSKVDQYKNMKGHGIGIAAHRSFLSYVALVVDVYLNEKNELTINEIHGAIDCGFAVNPDRVRAQMEGGINYGLSIALLGEISVKGGAVEQHNFDDYPVLRLYQTPKKIAVHIVDSGIKDVQPTGVGEPPTPVVAPALANAIFAAGGPRIREIPFRKEKQIVVL